MYVAIAIVIVVALIAIGVLLVRSRASAGPSTPPSVAKSAPAPTLTEPAPVRTQPQSSAASVSTPARAVRPSDQLRPSGAARAVTSSRASGGTVPPLGGELRSVCCQVHGATHGAMPPFGKLLATPMGLVFEATSRVISAAGGGLDDSDGATTMQSLGTMELGAFRFEIPRGATQKVEFQGSRAVLSVDGTTYVLEGLGPSAKTLAVWLQGNGFDS